MHLAGPEPRLNFGGGSFQCVNTTPSGIEIRTIGLWLIRGDTATSIEVCAPVTVGQIVHPSSNIYISDSVLPSVGGDCLPSLVATGRHGAIGGRMECYAIRADVVDTLDYVDLTAG